MIEVGLYRLSRAQWFAVDDMINYDSIFVNEGSIILVTDIVHNILLISNRFVYRLTALVNGRIVKRSHYEESASETLINIDI